MSVLNENTIIGASAAGGYNIPNSLRFNDDDSAYLSRTPSVAGNRKTWTWSGWVKRGDLGTSVLFSAGTATGEQIRCYIGGGKNLNIDSYVAGFYSFQLYSSQVLRDPSSWYHIAFAFDTTQGTSSNRIKVYLNGEQITAFSTASYPALNSDSYVNNTILHYLGNNPDNFYLDGYLSEVNFIDGQALTPDSFGETGDYGEWKPLRYTGAYGTNGFYLDFKNSGDLGNDVSGNANDWTPTNLAATDQMLDSPTNNFATLNPLDKNSTTLVAEGNLEQSDTTAGWRKIRSTIGVSSGKHYWEIAIKGAAVDGALFGVADSAMDIATATTLSTGQWAYSTYGNKYLDGAGGVAYGATLTDGDIVGVALDMDTGDIEFFKNNATQGVLVTGLTGTLFPYSNLYDAFALIFNFGQDSSFAGNKTPQGNSDSNGIGDFYYAPPAGFLALCTANLPDVDVIPSEHFNTVLWTGDNTDRDISVGFQPDFTWIKRRSSSKFSALMDSVRGFAVAGQTPYMLVSNDTGAESSDQTDSFEAFTSDGFSLGTDGGGQRVNQAGETYVAWNWKANGTGVSNTDGTITSTVSANVEDGFSIISYTGTGAAATVGHGLTKAPEFIISKNRTIVKDWRAYSETIGAGNFLYLNLTAASTVSADVWNNTAPASSVFSVGNDEGSNGSTHSMIAYAFHSVDGYSKVGSYTGNGSFDGTFIYTGFNPRFIMMKRTDSTNRWVMMDSERDNPNEAFKHLWANLSDAEFSNDGETAGYDIDFLSNGFKQRNNNPSSVTDTNKSGGSYIYIAFAESPFKHTNAR